MLRLKRCWRMLSPNRRLSHVEGFSYVHLLNHQVQQENPLRPIQFAAQASFKALQ